jgi:hypothetical protein
MSMGWSDDRPSFSRLRGKEQNEGDMVLEDREGRIFGLEEVGKNRGEARRRQA